MSMNHRSPEKELIDLGPEYYSADEYRECLYLLDRIGRFLGGDRATYKAFQRLARPPRSILDVGCGGGLFTLRLAENHPNAKVVGCDIAPEAIYLAEAHRQAHYPKLKNIEFIVPPSASLSHNDANSFDVVTATLLCHHLTDHDLIMFLKDACHTANQAVVINDLHRHRLASFAFACVTPLFFRNRLIAHDGQISIRRAFTYADWINYLQRANIPLACCSIRWCWAFRWIVTVDTAAMKNDS